MYTKYSMIFNNIITTSAAEENAVIFLFIVDVPIKDNTGHKTHYIVIIKYVLLLSESLL